MKTKLGRALLATIRRDVERYRRTMNDTRNIPSPGPERIVPHRSRSVVVLPDTLEYQICRLFWFVLGFMAAIVSASGWIALAFHEGWFTGRG